ncbi:MAG TPA: GNAT family N-acyltransferase [Tepidisphaeraceae bacterium]|nr:GNAT family N-acyltransferase [Tepidisphaeraceae bacterium]
MNATQQPKQLVKLNFPTHRSGLGRISRLAENAAESALALDLLNELYAECSIGSPPYKEFIGRVLQYLRVRWHIKPEELARIPKSGPLVVVANHPFGALEGLVLGAILSEVRDDVKVMANFLLGRITELRDLFIFVDPFEKSDSAAANVSPLRQSLRHLQAGGVLAVFPAGEVASFKLRTRQIVDPPWNTTVARIIQKCRCPVLPIYFDGRNSLLFQCLGLLHPRVRTAMLAREVFNLRGTRIISRVGSPIPFRRIEHFAKDQELIDYLRQRTYLLKHRHETQVSLQPQSDVGFETIIEPIPSPLLEAEVQALPPRQLLVEADDCGVYHARAAQIPNILRELGRLREITFRATGEGTGKACDIDQFDQQYVHLFVWNKPNREIVGAYRLGPTDEILDSSGKRGLYTSTLFECKTALLRHITPALEMGRSFVRAEYQKSFSPLLLLWKGIGHYVVQNPRYKFLFGPVSISNTYQSVSKQLMVRFLKAHHCPPDLVDLVQARNPFRLGRIAGLDRSAVRLIRDSDDVSELVGEIEPQHKGIPVLLRQYLKMGAKLLAFNVDPHFADCVDALMVCDLSKTDTRLLDRYMGKEGRQSFILHHTAKALPASRISAVMK